MKTFLPPSETRRPSDDSQCGRSISRSHRERGAALIAIVALTFIASLLLGAVMLNVRNNYTLSWARANSESALLLAEGGINDEISYINIHLYDTTVNTRSSQNTVASGEPYKGRKSGVAGVNGNFWVFTSSDAAGTTAWDGESSTLYITANAKVNGAWRQVQIGGPNMYQSIFSQYGVFGVGNNVASNAYNVFLNLGAGLHCNGTVGTNAGVSTGWGRMNFNHASNCNNSSNICTKFVASGQSAGKPVVTQATKKPFPSCTEVLKKSCNKTWSQLASSNDNSKIRTYNSSSPTLTTSGTKTCGFTGTNLYNSNFSTCNKGPGTTKKAMIFPPGDYYLTNCWLDYTSQYEIILDDQGVTVSGGNPTNKPIRFWMRNLNNDGDNISMPMRSSKEINTGVCDPKNLRIFYSNDSEDGFTFDVRDTPDGCDLYGAVYAVSDSSGMGRCRTRFIGDGDSKNITLNGGMVADHVSIWGECTVNFPGNDLSNDNDPPSGVKFNGGYSCKG